MGNERSGGCGAGMAILVAGTLLLGLAGGMAYLAQARRHEAERAMLEVAREEALRAREAELRAEAQRAEREAEERTKREAELAERFAREAEGQPEARAPAASAEAAPGVKVGVRLKVFRQGKLTGVDYEVLEVRGTRARVRRPGATDEVQTWLDFAQIPRYDLLPE